LAALRCRRRWTRGRRLPHVSRVLNNELGSKIVEPQSVVCAAKEQGIILQKHKVLTIGTNTESMTLMCAILKTN
jgi:hypothetical protein